jgi:hypothetical protein
LSSLAGTATALHSVPRFGKPEKPMATKKTPVKSRKTKPPAKKSTAKGGGGQSGVWIEFGGRSYTQEELTASFDKLALFVDLDKLPQDKFEAIVQFACDWGIPVCAMLVGTAGPRPGGGGGPGQ